MRVIQKETLKATPPALALEGAHVASPTTSIKEITPHPKKHKTGGKGKEKMDVSLWDDIGVALMRAHNIVTIDDLREFLGVPYHEVVNQHIHKLV